MDPLYTLPAESFALPNGSPPKLSSPAHGLAGSVLWAVGHRPDSRAHSLFYFHGIKGGSLRWHGFPAPFEGAKRAQLELSAEGGLGLRLDDRLFLGNVESVTDARISWTAVSNTCLDFQLGRDRVCLRLKGSSGLHLAHCDTPTQSVPLPSPSLPPDCYCLSSNDDVIVISAGSVLVLAPPYINWARLQTAPPPRTFLPALFVAKEPRFQRVCVSGRHLIALSTDGQGLSLLPLAPSPQWEHVALETETKDLCPVGSQHELSFLLLDRHSNLYRASLESRSLRSKELPHSLLPDSEVILSAIRCLNFDCPSQIGSLLSPSLSLSPSPSLSLSPSTPPFCSPSQPDAFFTASQPEQQPMEVENLPHSNPKTAPFSNSSFHTASQSAAPPADQLTLTPPHAFHPDQLNTNSPPELSNQLIPTHSPELPNQLLSTHSSEFSNQLIPTHSSELPNQLIPKYSGEHSVNHLIPALSPDPSNQLIPTHSSDPSNQLIPTHSSDLSNQLIHTHSSDPSNQLIHTHSPDISNQLIPTHSPDPSNQLIPTHSSDLSNQLIPTHSGGHSVNHLIPALSADLSDWVISTRSSGSNSQHLSTGTVISLHQSEPHHSFPVISNLSADPKLFIPPPNSLFSNSFDTSDSRTADRSPDFESAYLAPNESERSKAGSKRAKSPPLHWPSKFHRIETPPSLPPAYQHTDPGPPIRGGFESYASVRQRTDPNPSVRDRNLFGVPEPRSSQERRTDMRRLRERVHPCPLPPTSFLPYLPDFSHFQFLLQDAESKAQSLDPFSATQIILCEEDFDFESTLKEFNDLSAFCTISDSPLSLSTAPPTLAPLSPSPSAPPTLTYGPHSPPDTSTRTEGHFQL